MISQDASDERSGQKLISTPQNSRLGMLGISRIEVSIRLRRAIYLNDFSLVKRIISHHPSYLQDPDLADVGNTSLHVAARLGLVEIAVRVYIPLS